MTELVERMKREQRANIKSALLTLRRRAYTIRLLRSLDGLWHCWIHAPWLRAGVDVYVACEDRVDALANAIGCMELHP